jgi:valyl-tRNA synthetase
MSEAAQIYIGEDRFVTRKKIIRELEEKGFLTKEEEYTTRLGYSQRTGVVVEPRISTQWFVKMKELAGPALKAVVDGDIRIHPGDKFLATYKYWLENVKDWCISRQLWWGQQIPAWYDESGRMVVAENENEALEKYYTLYREEPANGLKQDADVLDTWFSSWLWPTQVFKGITEPGNPEIKYYYPGSVLVTGQDIIFFWVARMVMAGLEYEKQIPFKDVYFTGMVRDKLGRKMSKSLGNSPDLLDLIDKYGADAVRFGIMVSSPAGNDLMFDENSLEQGRHFNNKIWNALKLLKMWQDRQSSDVNRESSTPHDSSLTTHYFAIDWFENRLNKVRSEVDSLMKQFRLSEALKTIYSLIWDDFCSWYLEWIKPGFEQPIDAEVYKKTVCYFEDLMQLLHPFMPFVTEEIYHLLKEQTDDLCIKQFAPVKPVDEKMLAQGELLKQVITNIRDGRNKNQLKPKESIKLLIETDSKESYSSIESILSKQVNADEISFTTEAIANTIVVAVEKDKFYIKTEKELNTATLKDDLLKDLEHQKGFLASVEKKLSNEKFVQNARPEVLALEQKKKADAEARIRTIEESLSTIS